MSWSNETRQTEWLETCKCKFRLDASVFNNKQRWNNDKYRCECKELINKGVCDKRFILNPSNCECECESYKDIDIYYIGYITIKKDGDCENIYGVNALHLMIGEVIDYIEENNGNRYLVFDSTDENKEVLKKYTELWDGIKMKLKQ